MLETGVVIDFYGRPIYWHTPKDRTVVHLPDSQPLWDFIWENRHRIYGIAHSHPGSGLTSASNKDVSTFSAIERAFGRRLFWWITTSDNLILSYWVGPDKHQYANTKIRRIEDRYQAWLPELRRLSIYQGVRT